MIEDVYPTAPDGPMVADVRLKGGRSLIVVAAGAGIIAVGGLLLNAGVHGQPAPAASTSWSQP